MNAKTLKPYGKISVAPETDLAYLSQLVHNKFKQTPSADRQSIRLEPKGKALKDSETLHSLKLKTGDKVYIKDLGPQIGWKTVFLAEYAGPLVVYLLFYTRPDLVYGKNATEPISLTTQ